MSNPSPHELELMDLLSAVWDDRLDSASRVRLQELLTGDDHSGIELLTSFTRLHLDLEWLASSDAAHQKALASLATLKTGAVPPSRMRHWQTSSLLSLAASIILAVLGYWYFSAQSGNSTATGSKPDDGGIMRMPLPIARIVSQEDVTWGGETRFREGQTLVDGQYVELRAGTAQISLGLGADIVLQAPCQVVLVSEDLVRLQSGKIAVRTADWAVGFKVETNDLLITDIGTHFAVYSGTSGMSEVHVLEGLVIATPLMKGAFERANLEIKAGEAVRLSATGAFDQIAIRPEGFVNRLERFHPLRPIKIWNTGTGLNVGQLDTHWTITAGDKRVGPFPQPATICDPHSTYGNNDPQRSQWISVASGTTSGVPVRTSYTFETTFDLTGFELSSVRLAGLVLADNGIQQVWLNGNRLGIAPWNDWYPGVTFFNFHSIEINSGFVPGINRLSLVVNNETVISKLDTELEISEKPNPMALRVEWRAFGRPVGRTH